MIVVVTLLLLLLIMFLASKYWMPKGSDVPAPAMPAIPLPSVKAEIGGDASGESQPLAYYGAQGGNQQFPQDDMWMAYGGGSLQGPAAVAGMPEQGFMDHFPHHAGFQNDMMAPHAHMHAPPPHMAHMQQYEMNHA